MNCNNISFNEIDSKNTQERFTWAVTYIAYGEKGRGLSPIKFDTAMNYCREWKMNLVTFLIGKAIKGGTGVHTKETATATADAIFKFRYEQEVRAHNSESIMPFWTRNELSGIEFGEGLNGNLNRLDETLEPIYEIPEVKTSWKQKQIYHGQFLSWLAAGKPAGKIVRNALSMAQAGALTWKQFHAIRVAAGDITMTLRKKQLSEVEVAI